MVEMSKVYGYLRISRKSQNIERQERNILREYPDAILYQEAYTGTKIVGRTEFQKMLKKVEKGDTIVFDSVSRMSRNAEEGFQLYKELLHRGLELEFIKEPHINTRTFKKALGNKIETTGNVIADKYIGTTNEVIELIAEQQIELAFIQAEKEVMDLRQRTIEGLETARKNGKVLGCKKGVKKETKRGLEIKEFIKKYSKDFGGALKDKEIMEWKGIGRNTYYKYKKEILEAEEKGE